MEELLKDAFKRKGYVYSEQVTVEEDGHVAFEVSVRDKVYGPIVKVKTRTFGIHKIDDLMYETRCELLTQILEFGKDNMTTSLLKRLEKYN
jgi:hypothetical protein